MDGAGDAREVTPFFHRYLMEKEYRKRIDFSDAESRRLWAYDEAAVSGLIARMPMAKWAGARGSKTQFEDGVFSLEDVPAADYRATVNR